MNKTSHRRLLDPVTLAVFLSVLLGISSAEAEQADASPWLFAPIVSSDPKVGTSGGFLGGYLHRFDEASPVSTFALTGSYSNTDSYTLALFGKAYFGGNRHRLLAGVGSGKIRNDYADFVGTGLPVQTTDDLRFAAARYLYRLDNDWFVGAQFSATNYLISGDNWFSDKVLDTLGLTGFDSNGVGFVAEHDTRDNQNSPSDGKQFTANNLAYRKALGGDEDFETYSLKYRRYMSHGDGNVLAWRVEGRATGNAPRGAYSTVSLRGYVRGSYLAKHMMLAEVEERYRLAPRWSLAGFAGASCLFNEPKDCERSENWFPAAGAGVIYVLKPAAKMVVRLDVAAGKAGSHGVYVRFGHPF